MRLKLCSLIEYYKSHAENVHQSLVPDPFLILVNTQNKHYMQEIYFEGRYFERGLSKSYQKHVGPGTSDQSLFRLQNNFRKVSLLVMYYLTKFGVIM